MMINTNFTNEIEFGVDKNRRNDPSKFYTFSIVCSQSSEIIRLQFFGQISLPVIMVVICIHTLVNIVQPIYLIVY